MIRPENKVLNYAGFWGFKTLIYSKRVEVRFEPEWIGQSHYLLPLYIEDKEVCPLKRPSRRFNGGPSRIRTVDALIKSQVLYQLS